ncbi:MAG: hypothetical protein ENTB_00994 [Enterocloster aldenensis]
MDKERFLDEITDQISYKPLRPSIRQELSSHIEDRVEEYESLGLSASDAAAKALACMGDAVAIGTELNEIHRIQGSPLLSIVTALLFLTGFAAACSGFMGWTHQQAANGALCYIPGGILLVITALKGYPLLIRCRRVLAFAIPLLYLVVQAHEIIYTHINGRYFNIGNITYFATMLFAPVALVLLYGCRQYRKHVLAALFTCAGLWAMSMYFSLLYEGGTAALIFILTMTCTVCFMIHRKILQGSKRKLYTGVLAGLALLSSPLFLTARGRGSIQAFLSPQSAISSTWDDTYNGILIRRLIAKTPLTHGIVLSPEEMMDYGTGAWYFASRNPRRIGIDATGNTANRQLFESYGEWEPGSTPRYIHYNAENVTLQDILPQHYYNNYVIAVCILLFGWLPGLVLIGAMALFYLLLFSCIARIRGKLASSLAFCCGQCLLWQGVLYLLGNLGYQYASFSNLPLISEGRMSILANMLLLGMIVSAYRFDRVVDDGIWDLRNAEG